VSTRTIAGIIASALLALAALPAACADYPEIRTLTRDDLLYVQQQDELEQYYRLSKAPGSPQLPPLSIFRYRRSKTEDLFALNARLGMPYDGLAGLNGASDVRTFNALASILVPSQPGVFVRMPPCSDLEQMVMAGRQAQGASMRRIVVVQAGHRQEFAFFPGSAFTSVERAYFLGILFHFPVALAVVRGSISSPFGMRRDPFSGQMDFHNGLDIAAPEGTPVRAARDGTVTEAGRDEVLGSYLVISHPGGWQTVYGHLSSVRAILNSKVEAGSEVGRVGSTGRATGSHLHFEVRRKGGATDPYPLLAAAKAGAPAAR
jgi:murein DD-endopeptidase MepM/ murein hydrolase activator NlpD